MKVPHAGAEELEHAKARGATIHAEITGFATNSDGVHATKPEEDTMRTVDVATALQDAGLDPKAIGYINGHGTATEQGDIASRCNSRRILAPNVPMSTQKSYLVPHARCVWRARVVVQHRDDEGRLVCADDQSGEPRSRCGELDYIVGDGRVLDVEHVVTNNFAFGGVNTSIVISRWKDAA